MKKLIFTLFILISVCGIGSSSVLGVVLTYHTIPVFTAPSKKDILRPATKAGTAAFQYGLPSDVSGFNLDDFRKDIANKAGSPGWAAATFYVRDENGVHMLQDGNLKSMLNNIVAGKASLFVVTPATP